MIRDIQDEIMRLKKENDVCILAHLYQNDAILEVADYTGDSFALAKLAQTVPNKTVLMCGLRFMAETVKMLAPDKRVLLSNPDAGCPMAEQMDREVIEQVKEEIKKHVKVGCTGCGYCMPCPRGVDIPGTFRCYNAMYSEGKQSGRKDYLQCTAFRKDTASASQCVGCGKCEKHCPQHIEIRKELKCAASELEDVKYKVMKSAIQILKLW